jgi:hypothetical protein
MTLKAAISWIEDQYTDTRLKSVRTFLSEATIHEFGISLFARTPQSAPYHTEGPFLQQHIERMLTVLFAIEDGESLLAIEELAAKKEWHTQIEGLEHCLQEHAATMRAYCLLHDLAKTDVFTIAAPEGSKGMNVGFSLISQKMSQRDRERQRDLYQKYVQHFSIEQQLDVSKELAARFYDAYELRVHYPKHAQVGGSAEYKESYHAIGEWLRMREQDIDVLRWLTRQHIDVIAAFQSGPDVHAYEVFAGRAEKAGLDVHEAMELLLATVFLDACMGSLRYEHGRFSVELNIVFHFFESERQVAPRRLERRTQKAEKKKKRAFKNLLQESDLLGNAVFSLLEIPFGPERGAVMEQIHAYVRGDIDRMSDQYRSEELLFRLKRARAAFDAQKRS